MPLSNIEIHQALDARRLIIHPEPKPRTPTDGQECPYNTHSVDLRLSPNISIPKPGPYSFDVMQKGSLADFIASNSKKVIIDEDAGFPLQPGKFVLGQTLESVTLPILPGYATCLAARIEGKSSRALRVADSLHGADGASRLGRPAHPGND